MKRDTYEHEQGVMHRVRHMIVAASCSAYTIAFFCRVPSSWNAPLSARLHSAKQWGMQLVERGFAGIGVDTLSRQFIFGAYLLVFALVIPWIIMFVMGRGKPSTLGCRLPNGLGWRLLAISYVFSVPFLIWMVRSPEFAGQYMQQLRSGAAGFLGFYAVNMFAEHFLFQGVLLAALRRRRQWPEPVSIQQSTGRGLTRALQWIGMAGPTGNARGFQRARKWLGLADGCVFPILLAGILFGAVHLGKDPRELLLSIPGGVVLGYIAYRANTWLVPLMLHLATAGTACLLMVLAEPP